MILASEPETIYTISRTEPFRLLSCVSPKTSPITPALIGRTVKTVISILEPEQPDLTIDAATRTQVVDTILKRLNESYVFPEVAKKMETSIRERVSKKEYDQITSAKEFATKLQTAAAAAKK